MYFEMFIWCAGNIYRRNEIFHPGNGPHRSLSIPRGTTKLITPLPCPFLTLRRLWKGPKTCHKWFAASWPGVGKETHSFVAPHKSLHCEQHCNDVIMGAMASQITSLTIVYSIVYSGAYQRKYQSSTSLAFVGGIQRGPGEFPAQMASNAENVSFWWRHHELWTYPYEKKTTVTPYCYPYLHCWPSRTRFTNMD